MGPGMGGPGNVGSSAHLGGGGGAAASGAGTGMSGLPGMPASVPGLIPTTGASLLGGGNQLGAPCLFKQGAAPCLFKQGAAISWGVPCIFQQGVRCEWPGHSLG